MANNKAVNEKLFQAKSVLLSDTLHGLPDNQIKPFFKYIRENEDGIPTDGKLLSIFRTLISRFGEELKQIEASKDVFGREEKLAIRETAMKYPSLKPILRELMEEPDEIPSPEWQGNFFKQLSTPGTFQEIGEYDKESLSNWFVKKGIDSHYAEVP